VVFFDYLTCVLNSAKVKEEKSKKPELTPFSLTPFSLRRRGYKEAGVEDPTKYRFPMSEKYPTYYDHEDEEKNEKRNRG